MVSTERLRTFIDRQVPVTENRVLIRDFIVQRETKFVSVVLAPRVELTQVNHNLPTLTHNGLVASNPTLTHVNRKSHNEFFA